MIYYTKELIANGRKPVYKIKYLHHRVVVPYIEGENNSDYVVNALNKIDDVVNAIGIQLLDNELTEREQAIKQIVNRYRGIHK